MKNSIKPIALYLPQYHEIKENNEWWGEGFTEWTNVKKAPSLFKNHYQPHIPINNNYYNLNNNDVLINQSNLAKQYGIYGFCFYHYWFNGKLLLETPIHNLLESGQPDFPFCLCWANENWTRVWDGQNKDVLLQQNYSLEDDKNHINYLIPFFKDERYIKIDGKPVFLVYRSELHPNIKEATNIWRKEVQKAGFSDLLLIRIENFIRSTNPAEFGFDAGMEFAPDVKLKGKKADKRSIVSYLVKKILHKTTIQKSAIFENGVYSYPELVNNMINRPKSNYKYFRSVCPSWDNSPRRKKEATIYVGSTPQIFGEWVKSMKEYIEKNFSENEQLLFINAWNEWGEGCHLEPDEKWGFEYLEELKRAIT